MTPKQHARVLSQACYYVTVAGHTQKEAAAMLGVSEKQMGAWAKAHGWQNRMRKLHADMRKNPVKFDDSLSAFRAWMRINNPDLYRTILPAYNKFLNSL